MSKLINRVRSLLERGERIGVEDCEGLFEVKDMLALGKLARIPRERRHGTRAFFRRALTATYRGEDPAAWIATVIEGAAQGVEEIAVRCDLATGDTLEGWQQRLRAFSHA